MKVQQYFQIVTRLFCFANVNVAKFEKNRPHAAPPFLRKEEEKDNVT